MASDREGFFELDFRAVPNAEVSECVRACITFCNGSLYEKPISNGMWIA